MKSLRDWFLCLGGMLVAGYGAGLVGLTLLGALGYGLSTLFFPAALGSSRYVTALDGNASCGFLLGLCTGMAVWMSWVPVSTEYREQRLPYIRVVVAAFTGWIGLTFTVVISIFIVVFVLALLGVNAKLFSSAPQPRAGYLLCCYLPSFLWGVLLLRWAWSNFEHRSFADRWQDIGESVRAIVRPRPKDVLERFVLRVPLPLDRFLDRLSQEFTIETNPFVTLGQTLPIAVPGCKPVSVKLKTLGESPNRVIASFKQRGITQYRVEATIIEQGNVTLIEAGSQLPKVLLAYQMVWIGLTALWTILFVIGGLVMVVLQVTGTNTGTVPLSNARFPFITLVFIVGVLALIWLQLGATRCLLRWRARKQELFIVDLLQRQLGAELIERGPRPKRFRFFENRFGHLIDL